MGATSVTGVGPGAGEPNKGPLNNRTQYVSILDPHVVFSGTVYIDTGSGVMSMLNFLNLFGICQKN